MRSLYFRLFAWMWLAFGTLALTIFVIVFPEWILNDLPPPIRLIGSLMDTVGSKAVQIYEREGKSSAQSFISSQCPPGSFRFHLFIDEDNNFSMSEIPTVFQDAIRTTPADGTVQLHRFGIRRGATKRLNLNSSKKVIMLMEGKEIQTVIDKTSLPSYIAIRIIALFTIGVSVCYILYLSLVRPIKHLEQAALEISSGDLQARVPKAVCKRKDEIGDMARSFNTMADRLEQLIATQNRLLQDVSHELRSPLTRIVLALELARKQGVDQLPKWIERMSQETDRLESLINQFLTMAKIDSVPEKVHCEQIDLVGLLESLAEDARFEGQKRDLKIEFHYNKPAFIEANLPLLHSSIENIIRNAVRHASEGTGVEIELNSESTGTSIWIRDRGPGVPDADLEKIFDPFYSKAQNDQVTTGIGIGLSISKRVIRQLGGNIIAQNRNDGGLEFHIQLPAYE